jgi:hypothetical protein
VDERFAFAGAHFGDRSVVQDHPADQLHVVMAHLQNAFSTFTTDREGLVQNAVERRAVVELLFELGGFRAQFVVGQLLDFRLELVDGVDARPQLFDFAFVAGAEEFFECPGNHSL